MARRNGFSLIEVLITVMIFSVMTGALCVRLAGGGDDSRAARSEAESLAEWFTDKMTRARFEGAGFTVKAHRHWGKKNIRLFELTGNGPSSGSDAEYYVPDRVTMDIARISPSYVYNSDQHTLTPAVSINIRSAKRPAEVLCTVTVSGAGYVSVKL